MKAVLFLSLALSGAVFAQTPALPNPTPPGAVPEYKVPDAIIHSKGYFVTGAHVPSFPQSALILISSEDSAIVYKGYAYLKEGFVQVQVVEKQKDGQKEAIKGMVVRQDGNPLILYQGKLFANDKIMVVETQ